MTGVPVIDKDGVTHEILDKHGTICGRTHQTMATADATALTCLACIAPHVVRVCGHMGARVRNCPFQAAVYRHYDTRCACCPDCAHQCTLDI